MIQISASLMCCNPLILGEEIRRLEEAKCDGFHIDIMDGTFVKNFAMNIRDLKFIRKATQLPLDIHLMIQEPSRYISSLAAASVNRVFIHPESCKDPVSTLLAIRNAGLRAGVVISPHKALDSIPGIHLIDTILVMAVMPGFAGQAFLPETIDRVFDLSRLLQGTHILIEVDGAVSTRTIPLLYEAGARRFVAGSSGLFTEQANYAQAIQDLKAG
jgi:ribulose-phosphate 3-epimerase